jgi:hypothetical protein
MEVLRTKVDFSVPQHFLYRVIEAPLRYQYNTSSFAHYWSKGSGVDLLARCAIQPNLELARHKIPLLYQVDEAGDRLVSELHAKVGFARGQELITDHILNPSVVPPLYRPLLSDFFENVAEDPSWLDWDLLAKGLSITQRSGISGLVVLRDYCLMGGYESAAINKPLIYTGALKKGAVKRISETVEFWVDVTGSEALKAGRIGRVAVMKTRMIHSFARINILKHSNWDQRQWGMPLNLWDMLATNLGFSIVFLNGLAKMGFRPLEEEVRGVLHLWKYIGYLLGIPPEILPDSEEEGIRELYYWTMTQAPGDEDSVALARALQEEPVRAYYPTTALGRKFMREVHLFYNHYLLGDHSCKLLQLDSTWIGQLALAAIWKNKWQNRNEDRESVRTELAQQGRARHEKVKEIYLKWNKKG